MSRHENLVRALTSLDLTSLSETDTEASVRELCGRALTPYGHVAAVCILPRFVPVALRALAGSGVAVATVTNFPAGDADPSAALTQTLAALAAGADEVDVVAPWRDWRAGEHESARQLIGLCAGACEGRARLKVILESGELADPELIAGLSRAAVRQGAAFIKTSTGFTPTGATLDAAQSMLAVIADTGAPVGFKASGGIRSVAQAFEYLALADEMMGAGWATPETFRFGASGLLDAILAELR